MVVVAGCGLIKMREREGQGKRGPRPPRQGRGGKGGGGDLGQEAGRGEDEEDA